MKISLHEPFPILENLLRRRLEKKPYFSHIEIGPARPDENWDLLISDRAFLPTGFDLSNSVSLIPSSRSRAFFSSQVFRGGMGRLDDVTFSSIGEEKALLCIGKEILFFNSWIGPFEKPVPFDRNLSLYKNLAAGFAAALAEIRFEGE